MKDINLFKTKDSIHLKKIKSKSGISKDEDYDGYLIESSESSKDDSGDPKEARRIIQSLKGTGKKIGLVGGDDAFNRRVIESLKIDFLVSPERGDKKDGLKQRDSGLNHVVAKIASARNSVPSKLGTSGEVPVSSGKKGVAIVVDVSEISKLKGKEKALRLERIIQNIKVCRKVGCDVKIASLAGDKRGVVDEKGRKAIGVSLGMSSSQSAGAVVF